MTLIESLAPVTTSIGFLRTSLASATRALADWRAELHGSVVTAEAPGGLAENVTSLEPLTSRVRPRELLIATDNPEWVAVVDCGVLGSDPLGTVGVLTQDLAVQGLVIASQPSIVRSDGLVLSYAARQFEMFGPLQTDFLNYVRTISVVQEESGWRFDVNGTVQDFEELDMYRSRKARDRFSSEMLSRYCAALGLRPFDDDFWTGPSVLISSPVEVPLGARVASIAEIRQERGYDL